MKKIYWTPLPEPVPEPVAVAPPPVEIKKSPPVGSSRNRHKIEWTRKMTDGEKAKVLSFFLTHNGCIKQDECKKFKDQHLPYDLTIFQVTGQIATLHAQVTKGELEVSDRRTYDEFMDSRRESWAKYDSDRYRAYKERLDKASYKEPRFEAMPNSRLRVA